MESIQRLATKAAYSIAALALCGAAQVNAQTCVTQARMDPALRSALQNAASAIAASVRSGDAAAVRTESMADLAASFAGTEALIRSTSDKVAGDTFAVSQLYELDATGRKVSDATNADFACILKDAGGAEADFSISGLPPGNFAFAMVEASGARPWLLSLLLQQQGSAWKMAGFYPRGRSAAGHDGVWYWKSARNQAALKQPLLSWLSYEEAAALLQPAPFVSSSNLEKLRAEQRQAGPPEVVNGVSADAPYLVHGTAGEDYKFNSFASEPSDDNKSLHLILHLAENPNASADAIRARSEAAARALVKAHPELKDAYGTVFVFVDGPQGNPPVVTLTASQLQ